MNKIILLQSFAAGIQPYYVAIGGKSTRLLPHEEVLALGFATADELAALDPLITANWYEVEEKFAMIRIKREEPDRIICTNFVTWPTDKFFTDPEFTPPVRLDDPRGGRNIHRYLEEARLFAWEATKFL